MPFPGMLSFSSDTLSDSNPVITSSFSCDLLVQVNGPSRLPPISRRPAKRLILLPFIVREQWRNFPVAATLNLCGLFHFFDFCAFFPVLIPGKTPLMILSNATLFPGAILPLHIFEPRYGRMLSDVLESHRMFAIAMRRQCVGGARREVPGCMPMVKDPAWDEWRREGLCGGMDLLKKLESLEPCFATLSSAKWCWSRSTLRRA